MARYVAAGTIAELGDRACELLSEAARSAAGIDSVLLADGMTACWDHLRPHLGPAGGELITDLLAMRTDGLYSLVLCPGATEAEMIGSARNWSRTTSRRSGRDTRTPGRRGVPRHTPTGGAGATTRPSASSRSCARTWSGSSRR